ncbi:MAG: hypothetical protein LBE07_03225 [Gordonia sp. (in: high G+C Gram-positive bacteria)]|jgi:hypothetical protein|nr:hypothetical protein [Gordonia sp. (in: high G+C Gram-positive bacteria)]
MTTAETVQIPVMFGLRTRRLRVMLVILLGSYAITRMTAFSEPRDGWQWLLEGVGALALATSVFTVVLGDADPLPPALTAAVAALATAGLGAAWWATPATAGLWVQPGAPLVVFAVIAGLMSLRGRSRTAWGSSVLAVVMAAVWSLQHGGTLVAGGQLTLRIAVSLLPATLMAVLIRPMLHLTAVLEARRAQTMHAMAVTSATASERADQLEQFDSDVRPFVEQVAAGALFDEESAARAHLLEEDLRDSVRGRGWHTELTRESLADARLRGIAVRVFDDSVDGPALSAADFTVLRGGLVGVLASVESGAVTARILPPGRDYVAVITTVSAESVERIVCRRDDGALGWTAGDVVAPA